jgi:hypothetical protein
MTAADLPARPDPATGEPMPPHAPGWTRKAGTRPRLCDPYLLDRPDGQERAIAGFLGRRRDALTVAAFWFVLIAFGLCIGNGFTWVAYKGAWLIFAAGEILIYLQAVSVGCATGVECVSRGGRWVRTYELVEVKYSTRFLRAKLRMRDSAGRRVAINLADLFEDQRMWDL